MTYANNLDPDEAPQNVGLHLRSKLFDIQIIYWQKKWVETMNFLKKFERNKYLIKLPSMQRNKWCLKPNHPCCLTNYRDVHVWVWYLWLEPGHYGQLQLDRQWQQDGQFWHWTNHRPHLRLWQRSVWATSQLLSGSCDGEVHTIYNLILYILATMWRLRN